MQKRGEKHKTVQRVSIHVASHEVRMTQSASEEQFKKDGYEPKIRKSIFAEPEKRSLKEIHHAKTMSEKGPPRFPWMCNEKPDLEKTVAKGKRIYDDGSFKGGKDYEGW